MTETPATFVAHDVTDLINSLPTWFGFGVSESLVAVATHGRRRALGFRLRMDLPPPGHAEDVASQVLAHLQNQGAEGVVVIALTAHQDIALDLLDAIHAGIDETPTLELIVRARADGERYWTDEPGSSPEGVPYETSDHHISIVHAVAAGRQILPDRDALVERFAAVTGERRRWLEHAAVAILDEIVPQVARAVPGDLAATGMAVVEPIVDRARASGCLSDADLLRVAAWVSCVSVRDALWGQMTRDNAEQMLQVLTLVSASVVPPFEPAILSLAAFAAWLTGDGAQALIAVERALRVDPDYSMAQIVREILERGVSPEHWRGFDGQDDSLSTSR